MWERIRRTISASSATKDLVGVLIVWKYHTVPVTRQSFCDIRSGVAAPGVAVIGEDTPVPKASRQRTSVADGEQRRASVADLIGDRALSARSVLASALLGANQPQLTVAEL